jgi:signal transduction histidine kinase
MEPTVGRGYDAGPVPTRTDKASGPRVTPALVALAILTAGIFGIAARDALHWYDRPIPGILADPGGAISSLGLPSWEGKRLGLKFPSRIAPVGEEVPNDGSRARVAAWDRAVAAARSKPHIDAMVETEAQRSVVRLPMAPLEPFAWWVYAGSSLIGGALYTGAGLIALWASPRGSLSKAFTKFALTGGLFLMSMFDVHTERVLSPVFFLAFGYFPASVVLLMLNLPEPVPALAKRPAIGTSLEIAGISLGLGMVLVYFTGGDAGPLQTLASLLLGLAFVTFVSGFVFRYARSRDERRATLRALLLSMVPPYAAISLTLVFGSLNLSSSVPDVIVYPALLFAPLASLHAFVRHDLWGSRALLSRVGTNLFLGAFACATAIAVGTALASWMGASFRDALAGAAGGGVAAAVLVVLALRVSDFTLFRSRAQYKPTIDRLSEELTTLTSPEEVALAIERTVRRWLPCEYIRLTLVPPISRPGSVPPSTPDDDDDDDDDEVEEAAPVSRAGDRLPTEPDRASDAEYRMEVAFGGKPFGWLDAGAKRGGALFTSDDRDLLRTIANHGGLALAHAHAYQELEARRRQQAEAWRGEREALVETVAAEIAHEVRYPINYFRSLFERGAKSVALTADDIDVGREEVDRLERMVSGLKRMASHRLERMPTPVSELCARVETLLGDSLNRRRIEVRLGPSATLRCDPDKMTQVLVNLLSNALEACGPNGRLGVEWQPRADGGELTVWDDGPGFVGDASRLFAPWYTTKPRGTGLGLAITHRLVRAHGWSIAAQRRDARTMFAVTVRAEDVVRDGPKGDGERHDAESEKRVA